MELDFDSDQALLANWCAGSVSAGDRLLRRYLPILHSFFRCRFNGDADDLVQQTVMTCLHSRDRMLERGAFRAYLLHIARCRLYDHLRSRHRHVRRNSDGLPWLALGDTSDENARFDRERLASGVHDTLDQIPYELRQVVELQYWGEQSATEIAASLGVPVGTVKSRLRRAREALRRELKGGRDEILELFR